MQVCTLLFKISWPRKFIDITSYLMCCSCLWILSDKHTLQYLVDSHYGFGKII